MAASTLQQRLRQRAAAQAAQRGFASSHTAGPSLSQRAAMANQSFHTGANTAPQPDPEAVQPGGGSSHLYDAPAVDPSVVDDPSSGMGTESGAPGTHPGAGRGSTHPAAPASPPPGTYDPAYDANERAAQRGLGDLRQDTGHNLLRASQDDAIRQQRYLQGRQRQSADIARQSADANTDLGRQFTTNARDYQRGQQDIGTQRTDLNTQFGRSQADLGTQRGQADQGFQRNLSDLGTARERAAQDYQSNVTGLDRNYQRMGDSQTQAARAAGVDGGGAIAQALAKRQANEAIDKAPIDQSFQRFGQDSAQQEGRLRQDYATQQQGFDTAGQRLTQDQGTAMGRLDTSAQRLGQDYSSRTSALSDSLRRLGRDTRVSNLRNQQNYTQEHDASALQLGRTTYDQKQQLTRGTREEHAYMHDTEAEKAAAAKAAGSDPSTWGHDPKTQPSPGGRDKTRRSMPITGGGPVGAPRPYNGGAAHVG